MPFDAGVRVHVGVVALGTPPRLRSCLEALVAHESAHDFAVSCLVNPETASDGALDFAFPAGVHVERSGSNLGWPGGLQRLRPLSEGELFVWVQDDMIPLPGWLDALVEAADAHPRVGCFGALRVDRNDEVLTYNGGRAEPPDRVGLWNDSDTTVERRPSEVTLLDWVTSKGCLTRTAAFDEVGGPDPRLWPLNHVDKDYCTHLRSHGWDVALAPGARLLHEGSQSAPTAFRLFLGEWRDEWFDQRWSGPATALADRTSAEVEHQCAEWRGVVVDDVEAAAGRVASRMLVPLARRQAAEAGERAAEAEERAGELARAQARIQELDEALSVLEARLRRSRARRRRLKRRVARLQARLAEQPPRSSLRRSLGRRLRP